MNANPETIQHLPTNNSETDGKVGLQKSASVQEDTQTHILSLSLSLSYLYTSDLVVQNLPMKSSGAE
jgi:hypothetical protein